MAEKRKVEIFSSGCMICNKAVEMVKGLTCESCDVTVLDMSDPEVVKRAEELGIQSVPAVVVDNKLVDCCSGKGLDEETLRASGIGQPLE